jgi:hypothetical protein
MARATSSFPTPLSPRIRTLPEAGDFRFQFEHALAFADQFVGCCRFLDQAGVLGRERGLLVGLAQGPHHDVGQSAGEVEVRVAEAVVLPIEVDHPHHPLGQFPILLLIGDQRDADCIGKGIAGIARFIAHANGMFFQYDAFGQVLSEQQFCRLILGNDQFRFQQTGFVQPEESGHVRLGSFGEPMQADLDDLVRVGLSQQLDAQLKEKIKILAEFRVVQEIERLFAEVIAGDIPVKDDRRSVLAIGLFFTGSGRLLLGREPK